MNNQSPPWKIFNGALVFVWDLFVGVLVLPSTPQAPQLWRCLSSWRGGVVGSHFLLFTLPFSLTDRIFWFHTSSDFVGEYKLSSGNKIIDEK